MVLEDTSPYWRAAMVTQIIALFFAIISFSTPYHVVNTSDVYEEFVGIWQYCWVKHHGCRPVEEYFRQVENGIDWLRAARTLMTLAWTIEVLTIALTAGALHPKLKSKLVKFGTAGVALFAGLLGLIGVNLSLVEARHIAIHLKIFYKYISTAGWAYFLFLFSQIAILLCGALHIVDGVKFSPPGDSQGGDGSGNEQGDSGQGQGQGNNPRSGQSPEQRQTQSQNRVQHPNQHNAQNGPQYQAQNEPQYQAQNGQQYPVQYGQQYPVQQQAQYGQQYPVQQQAQYGQQCQAQQPTQNQSQSPNSATVGYIN